MQSICSVDGCERHSFQTGLCQSHYNRKRMHGDPMGGGAYRDGASFRFLEQAKEYLGDDCLTWPFGRNGEGRPVVTIGPDRKTSKKYLVSRLICEHAYGPPPTSGHQAAHSCGKGHLACIARKHLRWATVQENMDDKKIHGTLLKGEATYNAKLSDDQVIKIRELWPGMTQRALAERFKVSRSTVFKVVSGQIWTHI